MDAMEAGDSMAVEEGTEQAALKMYPEKGETGLVNSLSGDETKMSLRAGVIGPTDTALMEEKAGLEKGILEREARNIGRFLAMQGFSMVCIPDRGVALYALLEYSRYGGKNSVALFPSGSERLDYSSDQTERNLSFASYVKSGMSWEESPVQLIRNSDFFVCIGISCGTMIEIGWTKWVKRLPILLLRNTVSSIPPEIQAQTDIRIYNSGEDLQAAVLEMRKSKVRIKSAKIKTRDYPEDKILN